MPLARRIAVVICTIAVASSSSCRKVRVPASVVNMTDASAAKQLISGFYQLEGGSWRWTARTFSVALGPPPGSATKVARLFLRLHVLEPQFELLGPITLRATIREHTFDPQVFSKTDNYTYEREVPPELHDTNVVPVKFSLDKYAPPLVPWGRELGVVVASIGLVTK